MQSRVLQLLARVEPSVDDAFFAQWATSSLPENGHYKSLTLLPTPEEVKVDSLVQQLKPGGELKTRYLAVTSARRVYALPCFVVKLRSCTHWSYFCT